MVTLQNRAFRNKVFSLGGLYSLRFPFKLNGKYFSRKHCTGFIFLSIFTSKFFYFFFLSPSIWVKRTTERKSPHCYVRLLNLETYFCTETKMQSIQTKAIKKRKGRNMIGFTWECIALMKITTIIAQNKNVITQTSTLIRILFNCNSECTFVSLISRCGSFTSCLTGSHLAEGDASWISAP